jgi:hypothetical protein
LENAGKYGLGNLRILESDCFELDLDVFDKTIDVYFYDGDHAYESQRKAFTYFDPVLSPVFITVVDDYNYERVRAGTQDAFRELKYDVLFERFLASSGNGDIGSWWNGLYVALVRKPSSGGKTLPKADRWRVGRP